MKKFVVTNHYHGTVELIYGEKTVFLSSEKKIVLTETELAAIPEHKKYLLDSFLSVIELPEKQNKK